MWLKQPDLTTWIYCFTFFELVKLFIIIGTETESMTLPTNLNKCFTGTPFLKARFGSIQTCILECKLRPKCLGVNFYRRSNFCELLNNVTTLTLNRQQQPCVSMFKTEMPEIPTCPVCGEDEVCDQFTNTCEIKECPRLGKVQNGAIRGNLQSENDVSKVLCHRYYRPEPADGRLVCQAGNWSHPNPSCIPTIVCNATLLLPVDNATTVITGDMTPGTKATYTCDTGTVALPDGASPLTLTCQPNETWSHHVTLQCLKECEDPPNEDYATLDTGSNAPFSVRTYTCWAHYITPSGASGFSIECQSSGDWATPTESCVRDCLSPPTVAYSSLASGTTHVGSIRHYTCDTGHLVQINGAVTQDSTASIMCQNDGQWSENIECVPGCLSVYDLVPGLPNSKITASSTYDDQYLAFYGRLDNTRAWGAKTEDNTQFIQFDFGNRRTLTKITTQGFSSEWVTQYIVKHSDDCSTFHDVVDNNENTVLFTGNLDDNSHVTNTFPTAVSARCFRVNAQTWKTWITMRVALLGC